MVAAQGKLYLIGGVDASASAPHELMMMGSNQKAVLNTVEVYNPATNTWSTVAPMLTPRSKHEAVYSEGYIYVTGGECPIHQNPAYQDVRPQGKKSYLEDLTGLDGAERYSLATNKWEKLPNLALGPRLCHASADFRGKIYVIGGVGPTKSKLHKNCEVYNPQSNVWQQALSLKSGRFGFPAVTVDTSATPTTTSTSTPLTTTTTTTPSPSSSKKAKLSH